MESEKVNIIAIVGATASGKTKLSLDIAEKLGGEIISADSMQIYKEFEVLAAKPSLSELQKVKHYLINEVSVKEEFSVADFVKAAKSSIDKIVSKGKMPIIAGGTGLYVDSLINNVEFKGEKVNSELRDKLWEEAKSGGAEKLMEELRAVDKKSAESIHPNNLKKLIRALEFYKETGMPISEQVKLSKKNESPYNAKIIGIGFRDRRVLYSRINQRVDIMIKNGLIEEAESIFKISPGKTAEGAIGYKEVVPYLRGLCTKGEMIEKIKRETRRYAKRQLTWFRRNENIKWFYADDYCSYSDFSTAVIKCLEKN